MTGSQILQGNGNLAAEDGEHFVIRLGKPFISLLLTDIEHTNDPLTDPQGKGYGRNNIRLLQQGKEDRFSLVFLIEYDRFPLLKNPAGNLITGL